jgi:hypothetical protein
MEFDGISHYIQCEKKSIDCKKGITVEAWIKHQFGNGYIVHKLSQEQGYALAW